MDFIKKYVSHFSSGSVLIGATLLVNVFNLIFNAYLGRVLTFSQYGLVALVSTFQYIALIFFTALYTTVNHTTAGLLAKNNMSEALGFLYFIKGKGIAIALVVSILWLALSPFTSSFFRVNTVFLPILFTLVIILGVITASNKGFLLGNLSFTLLASTILLEAISKLIFAWLLVNRNLQSLAYAAIPLSACVAFLLSIVFIRKIRSNKESIKTFTFPRKFLTAAIITALSSTAFLSFDLILAKHFLSPTDAGKYAILALVGKMIYFFGILPNTFTVLLVSRHEGRNLSPKKVFYQIFAAAIFLTGGAFLGLILLGHILIPLVLGKKAIEILQYLPIYSAAIALFTISSTIISYHLARKHYFFPIIGIAMAVVMSLGITLLHANIYQFTYVILTSAILSICIIGILHVLETLDILKLRKGWIEV